MPVILSGSGVGSTPASVSIPNNLLARLWNVLPAIPHNGISNRRGINAIFARQCDVANVALAVTFSRLSYYLSRKLSTVVPLSASIKLRGLRAGSRPAPVASGSPSFSHTISHIVCVCRSKQVIGSHATPISYIARRVAFIAGMAYAQGRRAIGKFIGKTVSLHNLTVAITNSPIPFFVKAPGPQPASIWIGGFLNSRPKTFLEGWQGKAFTVVIGTESVGLSFDMPLMRTGLFGNVCTLPAATLAKAKGDDRMILHLESPYQIWGAMPRGVPALPWLFAAPIIAHLYGKGEQLCL